MAISRKKFRPSVNKVKRAKLSIPRGNQLEYNRGYQRYRGDIYTLAGEIEALRRIIDRIEGPVAENEWNVLLKNAIEKIEGLLRGDIYTLAEEIEALDNMIKQIIWSFPHKYEVLENAIGKIKGQLSQLRD